MKKFIPFLLAIALLFVMIVPAMAAQNDKPYPDIWDKEEYPYAIYWESTLFASKEKPILKMSDFGRLIVSVPSGKYLTYKYNSESGEWYQHSLTGSTGYNLDFSVDNTNSEFYVRWTSHDLLYNGTTYLAHDPNFFPRPLWVEMEKVTQGEMETTQTSVFGTMRILALCGVGLIASLVVLKLFGKRSLLYRG